MIQVQRDSNTADQNSATSSDCNYCANNCGGSFPDEAGRAPSVLGPAVFTGFGDQCTGERAKQNGAMVWCCEAGSGLIQVQRDSNTAHQNSATSSDCNYCANNCGGSFPNEAGRAPSVL